MSPVDPSLLQVKASLFVNALPSSSITGVTIFGYLAASHLNSVGIPIRGMKCLGWFSWESKWLQAGVAHISSFLPSLVNSPAKLTGMSWLHDLGDDVPCALPHCIRILCKGDHQCCCSRPKWLHKVLAQDVAGQGELEEFGQVGFHFPSNHK